MKIKNIIITFLLIIIVGISGFFIGRVTVETNKEKKKLKKKKMNQKKIIIRKI